MLYKLLNRPCLQNTLAVVLSTFFTVAAGAQDSLVRPVVTSSWAEYRHQVKADSTKRMVELKSLIPGLRYDLRYAGANNFMRRRMYPAKTSAAFLRLPAALALKKVQEELKTRQLALKIFDAYRPYAVTVSFWKLVQDERYVANPAKGSWHNRGIAVDLTLVDLKTGKERDMGTGFDNFSDTARHSFTGLPEEILQDRLLLKTVMEKHGFRSIETEWWHYYLPGGEKYELLDLDFKTLLRKP